MTHPTLVLASTSPFRRELLQRLGLPFLTANPEVDEARQMGESPEALVTRLAQAKAQAVAAAFPAALIIGSDQVACVDDEILGKPGNRERALAQLTQAAGKAVVFQTGLCLLNSATGRAQVTREPFRVHFRALTQKQIAGYLDREQPFNCAGSFKSEGLGIALFERIDNRDPTALIGLPLIATCRLLRAAGFALP